MLDQERVLGMLENVWEASSCGNVQINHNNRAQLYGIVMTMDVHSEIFQQLAEGCLLCHHLDDPSF